jgi:hypothetical protein
MKCCRRGLLLAAVTPVCHIHRHIQQQAVGSLLEQQSADSSGALLESRQCALQVKELGTATATRTVVERLEHLSSAISIY